MHVQLTIQLVTLQVIASTILLLAVWAFEGHGVDKNSPMVVILGNQRLRYKFQRYVTISNVTLGGQGPMIGG